MMSKTVFITGGARSGKSSYALARAESCAGRKAYIATAEPLDDEMQERIRKHKEQRGMDWQTFEEPKKLAQALDRLQNQFGAVVIDCLTLWLSNLLLGRDDPEQEIAIFLASLKRGGHPPLFIVSNEVGLGIVPDNALARRFRDLSGELNRRVAFISDEVYLVTAGIPLKIKPQYNPMEEGN